MTFSSFLARRYLRSTRNDNFFSFITAIAVLGIMLGTATLIIALSILGGFEREITEKVVGFTSHVQIIGFGSQPLRDYEQNRLMLEQKIPLVRSAAAFVAREALIRSREGVDGILLKGVDPEHDNSTTPRYLVAGAYDLVREKGGMAKIVLGRKLAARLAVEPGDRLVVFGIGRLAEGAQPRVMQFRVAGIYESGMAEYDDIYAFTDLGSAQMLFQIPGAVTGIDLLLTSPDSAYVVAERAQELLGYPHYARTVYDSYRNLFSWIELQKKPIPLILGLIIVVATVNIIGTLLMMVLDKTREIGVLRAMGATRGDITGVFLRQGLFVAAAGTLLGNLLALGILLIQLEFKVLSLPSDIYFMSSVPVLLRWEYFGLVSVVTLLLSLLSSLVPARLAARLHPVNAIRFS
jgi:lipoprotein-releasing system permease protein